MNDDKYHPDITATYEYQFKCIKCQKTFDYVTTQQNLHVLPCQYCNHSAHRVTLNKQCIDSVSVANLPDEFTISHEQFKQLTEDIIRLKDNGRM